MTGTCYFVKLQNVNQRYIPKVGSKQINRTLERMDGEAANARNGRKGLELKYVFFNSTDIY